MILRRERDDLSATVKVLKEKTTPELLRELQEKFSGASGLIDAKKRKRICISFPFCENNSFRLNFYKSTDFTLRNYSATTGIFSA